MKAKVCLILAFMMIFSMIGIVSAEETPVVLTANDVDEFTKGTSVKDGLIEGKEFTRSYFGFYDVDMTGVKSIELKLKMNVQVNGEFFRIKIDDPYSLNIGYVVVNKRGENSKRKYHPRRRQAQSLHRKHNDCHKALLGN